MKILLNANTSSSERRHFGRSIRLQPRAIAIQALCLGIVLFDLLGAIMGFSDFAVSFWNRHPFLAVPSMTAAILLFASLIELGIESMRTDPV